MTKAIELTKPIVIETNHQLQDFTEAQIQLILDVQKRVAAVRNVTKPYNAYNVLNNVVGDISDFCTKYGIYRGEHKDHLIQIDEFTKQEYLKTDRIMGYSVKPKPQRDDEREANKEWVERNWELCAELLRGLV